MPAWSPAWRRLPIRPSLTASPIRTAWSPTSSSTAAGPFTFVIDSASSRTVIYEHVRAQLGLKPSSPDPIIVYGINRSVPAVAVEPDRLDLVGQEIKGLTMGVLPDTEQKDDPDGVLGIDALSRYFVVLDRETLRLKLLPRDSAAAKAYAGWDRMALTPSPTQKRGRYFLVRQRRLQRPCHAGPVRPGLRHDLDELAGGGAAGHGAPRRHPPLRPRRRKGCATCWAKSRRRWW